MAFSPSSALPVVASEQTAKGRDRNLALRCPLLERLVHEGDRGSKEQHRIAGAGVLLGNAQGSERLARAARHDQLAAVGFLKAGTDGVDGLDLMR